MRQAGVDNAACRDSDGQRVSYGLLVDLEL